MIMRGASASAVFVALLCVIATTVVVSAAASEREALDRLTAWVEARGLDLSHVYINHDAPVRGLFAKKDIPKGTAFLRVPTHPDLRITSALMKRSSKFYDALSQHKTAKQLDEHIRAGLWLLEQKRKPDSTWAAWLESLPKNFSVPQVVCAEEQFQPVLNFTEGRNILGLRQHSQKFLTAVLNFLNTELFVEIPEPFKPFSISFDELQWAWYVVKTRSWSDLQVPFADMFNHDPDGSLLSRDESDNSLVFLASKDIKAGEEVFISYGPKSNQALWTTYGFTLPNNPHTCVSAVTDTDQISNPFYRSMMSSHQDFFLPTSSPCVNFRAEGLNEFLHAIRLQTLTRDDLNEAAHRIGLAAAPISLLNEYSAYREALKFLEQQRLTYLSTLEAERELYNSPDLNSCARTVLEIRDQFRDLVPRVMNEILTMWRTVLTEGVIPTPKNSADATMRNVQRVQAINEQIRSGQF